MTRKQKAIKSVTWSTISAIFGGAIGPISYIFKARFLSPEEIGLVAVIMVLVGFGVQILSAGFSQALVEQDELDTKAFSSFYVVNILVSLLFGLLLYLLSDFIEYAYEMEGLSFFLKLSSIQFVFVGLGNPYKGLLQRVINFKLLSIIDIIKAFCLFIITVALLFKGFGILSVVYANIVAALIGSVLLIVFGSRSQEVSFRFYFSFKSFKPYIHFLSYYSGKLSSSYLAQNVDALIVGLFLPDYILGFYYFAKNMIDKFRMLLTNSLTSFLFPFFAEIKNDFQRIKSTYLKTIDLMSLISFFVSFFILASANSFVIILFGETWEGSIIVFQVLSASMMFSLLTNNISTSMLYARGRVKELFYLDIISNIIFLSALVLFSKLGLMSVLIIRFVFILVTSLIIQLLSNKELSIKVFELIKIFDGRFISTLILALISIFITGLLSDYFSEWFEFFIVSLLFVLGYSGYMLIFEKENLLKLPELIRSKSKTSDQ